jgi:hypothetical protein
MPAGRVTLTRVRVCVCSYRRAHISETSSALQFGQRALKIENNTRIREEVDLKLLTHKLQVEMDKLHVENERANEEVVAATKELSTVRLPNPSCLPNSPCASRTLLRPPEPSSGLPNPPLTFQTLLRPPEPLSGLPYLPQASQTRLRLPIHSSCLPNPSHASRTLLMPPKPSSCLSYPPYPPHASHTLLLPLPSSCLPNLNILSPVPARERSFPPPTRFRD